MSTPPPPPRRPEIPRAIPPKSRTPLYLGLAAASAVSYYFYSAGGDPKVVQKTAEHDAARVSASLPGRDTQARKSAEETMARVGSTVDRSVQEGKERISAEMQKIEEKSAEAKNTVMGKINEADLKVQKETNKAKGGIMSWFGFGGGK